MYCLVTSSFLFGVQQDNGRGKKPFNPPDYLTGERPTSIDIDLEVERKRYNKTKAEKKAEKLAQQLAKSLKKKLSMKDET